MDREVSQHKKKKITLKSLWTILKKTVQGFSDDKVTRLSAALSYATIFSFAPFTLVIITVGAFFAQDLEGELFGELSQLLGTDVAKVLQDVVHKAQVANTSTISTIIGIGVILFSATTIFTSIQESLNTIWGIKPKPKKGWLKLIKNRLLSFSIIIALGFILLVTMGASSIIGLLNEKLMTYFPDQMVILFKFVGLILNIAFTTLVFLLIFKVLPDAKIKFRDVTIGAIVTTVLFLIGQYGISIYLSTSKISSLYGAAASILLLLVWVYYSATIVYIGAEFTKAWANELGGKIYPDEYAVSTRIIEIQEDGPVNNGNKQEIDKSSDKPQLRDEENNN
ncbi:MAG TPA: YihY/virulence factor BrkB family protein [Dysgonamonadaceae bacterium]|nr:YihY/virulence factor BrkB family protein [Dysgonamonadaceae bacterium]